MNKRDLAQLINDAAALGSGDYILGLKSLGNGQYETKLTPYNGVVTGTNLLGKLTLASGNAFNANTTADQAINLTGGGLFIITNFFVTGASINMTTAADFEVWDGASRSGNKICTSINGFTEKFTGLTSSNKVLSKDNSGISFGTVASPLNLVTVGNTIYASMGTPQGAPATVDIYAIGFPIG